MTQRNHLPPSLFHPSISIIKLHHENALGILANAMPFQQPKTPSAFPVQNKSSSSTSLKGVVTRSHSLAHPRSRARGRRGCGKPVALAHWRARTRRRWSGSACWGLGTADGGGGSALGSLGAREEGPELCARLGEGEVVHVGGVGDEWEHFDCWDWWLFGWWIGSCICS